MRVNPVGFRGNETSQRTSLERRHEQWHVTRTRNAQGMRETRVIGLSTFALAAPEVRVVGL